MTSGFQLNSSETQGTPSLALSKIPPEPHTIAILKSSERQAPVGCCDVSITWWRCELNVPVVVRQQSVPAPAAEGCSCGCALFSAVHYAATSGQNGGQAEKYMTLWQAEALPSS